MCVEVRRCDGARFLKSIAAPNFLRARARNRTRGRTGHSKAPFSRATGGRLARVTRGETISGSASTVIISGLPSLSKPSRDLGSGGLPSLLDFASSLIIHYRAAAALIFYASRPVMPAAAGRIARLRAGPWEMDAC